MSEPKVWVVLPDGGYEGYSLPSAAFLSKDEADAYANHMREAYRSYAVAEVPLMRFVSAVVTPASLETVSPPSPHQWRDG